MDRHKSLTWPLKRRRPDPGVSTSDNAAAKSERPAPAAWQTHVFPESPRTCCCRSCGPGCSPTLTHEHDVLADAESYPDRRYPSGTGSRPTPAPHSYAPLPRQCFPNFNPRTLTPSTRGQSSPSTPRSPLSPSNLHVSRRRHARWTAGARGYACISISGTPRYISR